MYREQILGTWQSIYSVDVTGGLRQYDREQITFYSDGTGSMRARTLLRRNSSFTWTFDGSDFYVYNLGGPGDVLTATIEGDKLGIMGMVMGTIYTKI